MLIPPLKNLANFYQRTNRNAFLAYGFLSVESIAKIQKTIKSTRFFDEHRISQIFIFVFCVSLQVNMYD